jgi:hypothetical protein
MAREGYLDARDARDKAKQFLDSAIRELAELDDPNYGLSKFQKFSSMSPDFQERIRKERQAKLEECKADYAKALKEFEPFDRTPKKKQIRYDVNIPVNLSVSIELANAMHEEQEKGVSRAEIVRRALLKYYGMGDDPQF